MSVTFYCYNEKGKFHWHHQGVFDSYWQGQPDGNQSATFDKSVAPKTLPQMAYYHKIIVPEALKAMIASGNDTYKVEVGGGVKEFLMDDVMVDKILKGACHVKSKARMNMEEASEYIDRCIMWCARYLGCAIPEPDRNWKETKDGKGHNNSC